MRTLFKKEIYYILDKIIELQDLALKYIQHPTKKYDILEYSTTICEYISGYVGIIYVSRTVNGKQKSPNYTVIKPDVVETIIIDNAKTQIIKVNLEEMKKISDQFLPKNISLKFNQILNDIKNIIFNPTRNNIN